jgi:hypothetical protein
MGDDGLADIIIREMSSLNSTVFHICIHVGEKFLALNKKCEIILQVRKIY